MSITAPYYPIIYIRGFAATMGEIEDTAATPYMGFNLGATKIRQDHKGRIVRFIFESPLLRLMKDEGYRDTYKDGSELGDGHECPDRCIWIFRYYEQASRDLGTGKRQTIPDIAQDLRRLILRVRELVCRDDQAKRDKFRVHLVAHSMGGLIARCYLQNLCVYGTGDAALDKELQLQQRPRNAAGYVEDAVHLVDKVFTYGTPHNGIDLLGMNVPDLGVLDSFHVRNFNRDVIREYLKLPAKNDSRSNGEDPAAVHSLNNTFPEKRFFCLVGTNYNDYAAFMKLSRRATGPMSDGLVMIQNAAVKNAPRAMVHRSHSGHFGIVNSEEGYQNLRRFLFGNVQVAAQLLADEITLPRPVQEMKDKGHTIRASYQIETTARVRGSTCYLHERKVEQASSILREYDAIIKDKKPVYLFTGYLMTKAKTEHSADTALAFALRLSIRVPMYEVDRRFWFDDHFEGGFVFDETLTFHVRPRTDGTTVRYGLESEHGLGEAPRRAKLIDQDDGSRLLEIPLGFAQGARNVPRPGFRGRLQLLVQPWNA